MTNSLDLTTLYACAEHGYEGSQAQTRGWSLKLSTLDVLRKLKWDNSSLGLAISNFTKTRSVVLGLLYAHRRTELSQQAFCSANIRTPLKSILALPLPLFIQTHVSCLGDKVYGMPHNCHKSHLSGTARAEVSKITYI
jgi:hypothetical protein